MGVVGLDGLIDSYADKATVALDLGCGMEPRRGLVGLDKFATGENVMACDLFETPWKIDGQVIDEGSVGFLFSSHFVEHVPDWNRFFEEAYRVLKPGARFVIVTPYYLSVRATQDPDHKQMISEQRYYYLDSELRKQMGVGHYSTTADFEIETFYFSWDTDFAGLGEEQQEYHKRHTPNAVLDIVAVLRKRDIGLD